jgi:hypothetical protein
MFLPENRKAKKIAAKKLHRQANPVATLPPHFAHSTAR